MAADFDLIFAVRQRLLADPAVAGFIGTRFYDPPPQASASVTFPYISLGPTTVLPDDYDCVDGESIGLQLDIWTRGSGEANSSVQCRRICSAVRGALHNAEFTLAGTSALATLEHSLTRVLRDPDGETNHGVVQFDAVVEIVG